MSFDINNAFTSVLRRYVRRIVFYRHAGGWIRSVYRFKRGTKANPYNVVLDYFRSRGKSSSFDFEQRRNTRSRGDRRCIIDQIPTTGVRGTDKENKIDKSYENYECQCAKQHQFSQSTYGSLLVSVGQSNRIRVARRN